MSNLVASHLARGIIVPTSPEEADYYSTVFLVPKSDGENFRLIINLKRIKHFMEYQNVHSDHLYEFDDSRVLDGGSGLD